MRVGLPGAILAAFIEFVVPAKAQGPAVSFPEAAAPTVAERTIRFPVGRGEKAAVASFRFKPRPGLTQWFVAQWCGVTVTTGQTTSKPILVVGTGVTGSVTCQGLKDAGLMPPDGAVKRIGLVYRTASPNFPGVTPVLLALNPLTGDWAVDHGHDDAFDQTLPAPSLASMRRILSTKHR